ncbi:hypothetical protein FF011L_14150 [Roseimaritima multifibrata]|uniref:Zinc finger/thioredoxin putative domain-containing protein n=1 Tax=Roseimaritima multifibrata TaxID=1930274 RepID=A0A517MCQ0_9BACT|nr:hypothetical protein [Roseimaritima multifibrata]QDS92668.1 hypothetical protein FF011L_14150 [Roseimaritima multifibrata]
MPISIRCPQCSTAIKAPDQAAGKRVKCPKCATVIAVPAAQPAQKSAAQRPAAPKAAAPKSAAKRPPAQRPASPAPTPSNAYSPFESDEPKFGDDDLLTQSDFDSHNPFKSKKPSGPDIPQAKAKAKRADSFYKTPAIVGMVASGLNISAALVLVILLIIGIVRTALAGEDGMALAIGLLSVRLLIFAGFTIGGGIQSIIASLNLWHRTSRNACMIAVGEFIFNPLAFGLLFYFSDIESWIVPLVIGGVFAIWNWTAAVWFILAVSGEQAKIDFEEIDSDEIDELAAELQRRAAKKEGGGH